MNAEAIQMLNKVNSTEWEQTETGALRPKKTGRRESRLGLTLHTGPRQGRAAKCGHSVHSNTAPRINCFDCWHYYFSINPRLVYACFEFLRTDRTAELVAVHGAKFVKQFKRFVEHVQNIAPIQAEDAVTVGAE